MVSPKFESPPRPVAAKPRVEIAPARPRISVLSLHGLRQGQQSFVLGTQMFRLCAFKARRQYGKTTVLATIALRKMLRHRNHTVIFGSAKLSLATEIVRKQGQAMDGFGSRADLAQEAALLQNLAADAAPEIEAQGKQLKIADAQDGRVPDHLSKDDFAHLFEKRRLEFRIYHDASVYSRTKVIALTPSAVGETGDMIADEIARIKNWPDVWEAIEPIISADPDYRLILSSTPAPDDTHLAFEMLRELPGLDLPVCATGNWFHSEFGIDVLRLTAWDAHLDGVGLWDANTGKLVTPEEHRAQARDLDVWERNYGARDIIGGTGAIGLLDLTAAQLRGEGKCLHVKVKSDGDLEEAIAWLQTRLGNGPVGCGWDLATTTERTSNPSAFSVIERFGGVWITRLICTWKTDSDTVQESRARLLLDTIAARPEGGRARRLCIDATNERLFARRMQTQLGRNCTVELIVGSESATIPGSAETMNQKTLLGTNYMDAFRQGQIDMPSGSYVKEDHRLVKREQGLFVCLPAPDGKHGDTFDTIEGRDQLPKLTELRSLLTDSIFGVDRDADACRVARMSLAIALLDYADPPDVSGATSNFKLPTLSENNILRKDFFELDPSWPRAKDKLPPQWI